MGTRREVRRPFPSPLQAGDHQPLAAAGSPGRVLPAEVGNNQGSWARVSRGLGRVGGLGNKGSAAVWG